MVRLLTLTTLAVALAVAGCMSPMTTATPPSVERAPGSSGLKKPEATQVVGLVRAPAGVISTGGGNVISTGGGNVISTGGGNVISTGGLNYRIQAVQESPLAGAEVFLADAAGKAIPGLPATLTDAGGNYRFVSVPVGYAYTVVVKVKAQGKDAVLKSLVQTTSDGAVADVSTASTLLTTVVTQGKQGVPTSFDVAAYRRAVKETASLLADAEVPDLSNAAAVAAKMNAIAKDPRVGTDLAAVKSSVPVQGANPEAVKAEAEAIAKANPSAAPSNAPSASADLVAPVAEVTAITGTGTAGFANGTTEAALNAPNQVAFGPRGVIYIADTLNHRIRKFDPATGELTTLAGTETAGYVDGPGAEAAFNRPTGLAVGKAGQLYVADTGNHLIRQVSVEGVVSTIAGSGEPGAANGTGIEASFNGPTGIAVDAEGNLIVADAGGHRIRRIRFVAGPRPSASPSTPASASPSPATSASPSPSASASPDTDAVVSPSPSPSASPST